MYIRLTQTGVLVKYNYIKQIFLQFSTWIRANFPFLFYSTFAISMPRNENIQIFLSYFITNNQNTRKSYAFNNISSLLLIIFSWFKIWKRNWWFFLSLSFSRKSLFKRSKERERAREFVWTVYSWIKEKQCPGNIKKRR